MGGREGQLSIRFSQRNSTRRCTSELITLANAHLMALGYLKNGGDSVTLNCGYGHGYSVREVLDTVCRLNGKPIQISETDRRPGDPPSLVADARRICQVLNWQPSHDNLDAIVASSLNWERNARYG